VSKFTNDERSQIQNIVANLTIKRIPDPMIIKHIFNQTGKSISRKTLWNIRQRLKKESYHWYSKLREGEYEYLHEFKERINEIVDLQKKAHKIFDDNIDNPDIQLDSIAELHKLNITLSNYFDVAPSIGNTSISEAPKTAKRDFSNQDIIV
jgi:hypothetical protein